jgi:hypothetical protein
MSNAPIYIDFILATCVLIAAITQCVWLAFHGNSIGRWMQAIGWAGLATRLFWSIAHGDDPQVATVSIPLLIMAAGGAALTAVQQMRMLWVDVRCMQDPSQACFRTDRVRAALREKVK